MKRTLVIAGSASLVAVAWIGSAASATPSIEIAALQSQVVSGSGADVPSLKPVKAAVIVTLRHSGDSNFIVHPIFSNGKEGYSWANEIGDWSGTVFQAKESKAIVAASVEADGNWTIRVAPLDRAPVVNSKGYRGSGTAVVQFSRPSTGFHRIKLTHDGESNFIVHPITPSGDEGYSLVNEIGSYSGTKVLPVNTQYVSVIADGNWSLRVS
jgi:hypothetical protein